MYSVRITPAVLVQVRHENSDVREQERYRKSDLRQRDTSAGRARVAAGRSRCWWLDARRNGIICGDLVFGGVQDIAGKLLSMRIPPLCLVVHALTVGALSCARRTTIMGKVPTGDALLPAAAARACFSCLVVRNAHAAQGAA